MPLWGAEAYKKGKEEGRRDHKLVEAARKAERTWGMPTALDNGPLISAGSHP
jgi:hypothetical protein